MKKIISLFSMLAVFFVMNAQSDLWNYAVNEFLNEMETEVNSIAESFAESGIKATGSVDYNAAKRQLIIDIRFEPQIWNLFNSEAMEVSKNTTLEDFRQSYRTDSDFRYFIDLMKDNNASFKVAYSCMENGRVKTKDIVITPAEIMR